MCTISIATTATVASTSSGPLIRRCFCLRDIVLSILATAFLSLARIPRLHFSSTLRFLGEQPGTLLYPFSFSFFLA